jgi:hypothetical protein
MKKIFSIVLCGGLILASCSKDDNSSEKFSTQSVEANKAFVEESGVQFVGAMKRMESLQTIDLLMNFESLNSTQFVKGTALNRNSKLNSTINALLTAASTRKLNGVFNAMANPYELKSTEPTSLQQFWNESVGTYTWNPQLSDWTFAQGGTKVIFLFPSSETATTNDATLTISNYQGVTISSPVEEDYTGDLPSALNIELKKGTNVLLTYVFGATYNNEGIPSSVASDLTVETFKFEVDLTNNSSEVSVNYKLSENNNTLIDLGISGKGNFTEQNFDANTHEFTEDRTYIDYVYNSNTQEWDEVTYTEPYTYDKTDFEEIINSASAHFQILNVALRGDINIKGLKDGLDALNEDSQDFYETAVEKINDGVNLRLVNATNDEIIAKAEAYVANSIEGKNFDFRLTFGDNSTVDAQTYFEQGFGDFIDEINELISDINADYDYDISPIEY